MSRSWPGSSRRRIAEADDKAHRHHEGPSTMRRERHQPGGARKGQHSDHEDLAAADPVTEPAEKPAARNRRYAGREQDHPRLAEREVPIADEKGEGEAD